MPYIDYAEWFTREQKRRQQATTSPSGAPQVITQTNTPTSAEIIGKEAANIGGEIVLGEVKRRAGEALAQSGTQVATQAGTQGAGQAGAQTAGSAGVSTAGQAAGAAGAALGSYNLSRDIVGRRGATSATVSGMQTGAGIGAMVGGPVGAGIGAALGAATGAIAGSIWSPRKKNIEKDRWKRLEKYYGFTGLKPEWVDTKDAALKAQDKTLPKDFVGYNDKGQWVNNKFVNSGKNQDLQSQDIFEFATNVENFGKEYLALPQEKKLQMMDIALRNNLVKERAGTVNINWTPETYQEAANILYNDPNVQKWQAGQPRVYESPGYVPPWERK
jgi:hypothetical protein